MNSAQAKKVPLYDLLMRLGHHAIDVRKGGDEVWYRSPFRPGENTASFKIKMSDNVWYDFGEGAGGNVLDFVMKYQRIDFKGALTFLETAPKRSPGDFKDISAVPDLFVKPPKEKDREIIAAKPIFHYALKEYLKERGIANDVGMKYLREVNYKVTDKEYFALGFANRAGGWELRSSVFKGGIGEKDISVYETGNKVINAFEGFMDYLSYLTLNKGVEPDCDVVVLNSASMKEKALKFIKGRGYEAVHTYFDNDAAGEKINEYFKENLTGMAVTPQNEKYAGFKDLNEFVCDKLIQK
jgi:hypothetical protein